MLVCGFLLRSGWVSSWDGLIELTDDRCRDVALRGWGGHLDEESASCSCERPSRDTYLGVRSPERVPGGFLATVFCRPHEQGLPKQLAGAVSVPRPCLRAPGRVAGDSPSGQALVPSRLAHCPVHRLASDSVLTGDTWLEWLFVRVWLCERLSLALNHEAACPSALVWRLPRRLSPGRRQHPCWNPRCRAVGTQRTGAEEPVWHVSGARHHGTRVSHFLYLRRRTVPPAGPALALALALAA